MNKTIKNKIKYWSWFIFMILINIITWGYAIWHLSYSWNHSELTSMQVFKHILNRIF